ncbi:DsbA family protein [Lichenicoccus sp.]|uniref:DsbA family protein n=1 Tax=Lichenicoccus sp. TaxID=2781899 RepID=UPI003D0BB33D
MRFPARSAILTAALLLAAPLLPGIARAQAGSPVAPGSQAEPGQFTPAQRQEIIAIIRGALKSDPSILNDAILSLRAEADRSQAVDAQAALARNRAALAPTDADLVVGSGGVTLVEFYDPRCPYCRKVLPDLDRLAASDGRVRLVEKLIPILGPASVLQARAIVAAGRQRRASALQHILMTDTGQPDGVRLRSLAQQAGLNADRLERDMADPAIASDLQRNIALAQALGITGTPSFVVADRIIPGALDLAALRQAVAAARTN